MLTPDWFPKGPAPCGQRPARESTPQQYIATDYALYSQSLGAVLSVGTGLLMLMLLVRDMIVEITARSDTDTLSGLCNRRGFDERAEPGLAGALRMVEPERAIISRWGGEEFVAFLPGRRGSSPKACATPLRPGRSPASGSPKPGSTKASPICAGAPMRRSTTPGRMAATAFASAASRPTTICPSTRWLSRRPGKCRSGRCDLAGRTLEVVGSLRSWRRRGRALRQRTAAS
jgi:hypothetical protein